MLSRINYLLIAFLFILSCEGPLFEIPPEPDTTAPLIEIVHRKIELRGKQLRKIKGSLSMGLSELPPKGKKQAEALLRVGAFILV